MRWPTPPIPASTPASTRRHPITWQAIAYSPNRTWTFSTRARFDEATGNVDRFEAEGKATFDRWSVSLLYGDYAAQPDIGYLTRREGVLATGSVKVASNWVVTGAARWDLVANQINQYVVGAAMWTTASCSG